MNNLKSLWKETKEEFYELENSLINCYIGFLREVAKIYLNKDNKVFFRENKIVHWGEWDFGKLIIETDDNVDKIFNDYIPEIHFKREINEKIVHGCIEIRLENLEDIKYKFLNYPSAVRLS